MKITPKIETNVSNEVKDVYFDLTLVVTKDNELIVVDNVANDYHDVIDCDTLAVQQVKIRP